MPPGARRCAAHRRSEKTASFRKAITQEFGPSALQVLRESQAWFREQTRRFLEEGGDPAF